MSDAGVLNIVLFLPLLGAGLLLVSPAAHDDFTRRLTLGVMIAAVRAHRLALRALRQQRGRPAVRDAPAVDRRAGA